MNRLLVPAIYVVIMLVFLRPIAASPPANQCAGPCYICSIDSSTCLQRWWSDLDSTIMPSFPAQIDRLGNGRLVVSVCQSINGQPNIWCGGEQPSNRSLRTWCSQLMKLSVPPRLKPSDPGDLYSWYQASGVCP